LIAFGRGILKNEDESLVSVVSINPCLPEFDVTNFDKVHVAFAPGEVKSYDVRFTPQAEGTRVCPFDFQNTSLTPHLMVIVHGTGVLPRTAAGMATLLLDTVNGLAPQDFTQPGGRMALQGKLQALEDQIAQGDTTGALAKLQNDIIPHLTAWIDPTASATVLHYAQVLVQRLGG
jgi:hypothetical protein